MFTLRDGIDYHDDPLLRGPWAFSWVLSTRSWARRTTCGVRLTEVPVSFSHPTRPLLFDRPRPSLPTRRPSSLTQTAALTRIPRNCTYGGTPLGKFSVFRRFK